MKTILLGLSIGVSIAAAGAALILFTAVGDRPLTALLPVGDIKVIDFEKLKLTDDPNQFLICPPDFCDAKPNAVSPEFDIPLDQLRQHWDRILAAQPRIERLAESHNAQQFDYVQRTARFRFPDLITVRFLSVSPAKSTIAIYSRSLYGKSDFGINRDRITTWLKIIREELT